MCGAIVFVAACKETGGSSSKTPAVVADVSSADASPLVVSSPSMTSGAASPSSQVSLRGNVLPAGQYKLAIDEKSTTCPAVPPDAGAANILNIADQTFGIQIRDSKDGKAKVANVPVVFYGGHGVARIDVRLEKAGHGSFSSSHTSNACSYQTLHTADVVDVSSTRLVLKAVSTYGEILGSCPTQPMFSRCNREAVLTYTLVKAD